MSRARDGAKLDKPFRQCAAVLLLCAGAVDVAQAETIALQVREHLRVDAAESVAIYAARYRPVAGDLIVAYSDGRLAQHRPDSERAQTLLPWPREQSFAMMHVSPDERHLLLFTETLDEQVLHVCDLQERRWISRRSLGDQRVSQIVLREDGRESLFTSEEWLSRSQPAHRTVRLWPDVRKMESQSQPFVVSPQENWYFVVTAASKDLNRVIVNSPHRDWLYEWAAGAARLVRELPSDIHPREVDPAGKFMVSTYGADLIVSSLTDPNLPRIARCETSVPLADIRSVALDRRGLVVAVSGSNSLVELWDPLAGARLTTLDTTLRSITSVAFCSTGDYLIVTSRGGVVVYALSFANDRPSSRPAPELDAPTTRPSSVHQPPPNAGKQ